MSSGSDWLGGLMVWFLVFSEIWKELNASDSEKSVSVSVNSIGKPLFYEKCFDHISRTLTVTLSLLLDGFLVFIQLIVSNGVERILSIRRFIYCCVVLVAPLNNALWGGTHEDNVITSCRYVSIFQSVCFIPGNTFQNVRLWTSRNLICPSIILDLRWFFRFQWS